MNTFHSRTENNCSREISGHLSERVFTVVLGMASQSKMGTFTKMKENFIFLIEVSIKCFIEEGMQY